MDRSTAQLQMEVRRHKLKISAPKRRNPKTCDARNAPTPGGTKSPCPAGKYSYGLTDTYWRGQPGSWSVPASPGPPRHGAAVEENRGAVVRGGRRASEAGAGQSGAISRTRLNAAEMAPWIARFAGLSWGGERGRHPGTREGAGSPALLVLVRVTVWVRMQARGGYTRQPPVARALLTWPCMIHLFNFSKK